MSVTSDTPVALAARAAEAVLASTSDLASGFRTSLPRATDVVARRLVGAVVREGANPVTWSGDTAFVPTTGGGYLVVRASRHAFGRVEVTEVLDADPALLLGRLAGPEAAGSPVAAELTDASVNLAVAYARRARIDAELAATAAVTGAADLLDLAADLDPDEQGAFLERCATEGHNLHPCARTRLGWSVADLLAYDLESDRVEVGFVGVRRDVHIGDQVGPVDDDGPDPGAYAITPVHAWQLDLIGRRYPELVAGGVLVPLDRRLTATPTAALRTLLLPAGPGPRYLKLSLDIQVTSTRRTISVASTRNGPALSAVLAAVLAEERVVLMAETAGSAALVGDGRDLSAIARDGLTGRLHPGEVAVPGAALYAASPVTGVTILAELVDRYARTRELTDRRAAALRFLSEYAGLLLPPVLRLAARHGIGLEAHLQNCVPTFVDGVPHRLGLRDLAGMRLYPARLDRAVPIWPGSVIVTDDVDVMRAKVAYTALQAHLGELVIRLGESHGLGEAAAWSAVRAVIDETYDELAEHGRADHAFLTAPRLPHKALLGMRLAAGRGPAGDLYVQVENPLR